MSEGFELLNVHRCPHCDQDAPHVETETIRRCLACGHETEVPDATA